jgi:hypothetical protein
MIWHVTSGRAMLWRSGLGWLFECRDGPGIAHFRQPHNFLALGRQVLRDRAPDVLDDILALGARENRQYELLPAEVQEGDEWLVSVCARRPLLEYAPRPSHSRTPQRQRSGDLRARAQITRPPRAVNRAIAGSLRPTRPGKAHDGAMKAPRAAARRYLPGSPFNAPPAAPPAETFAVHDQVTHDKYGLGVVLGVEDHAVLVDFRPQQRRIPLPCAKLTKL